MEKIITFLSVTIVICICIISVQYQEISTLNDNKKYTNKLLDKWQPIVEQYHHDQAMKNYYSQKQL